MEVLKRKLSISDILEILNSDRKVDKIVCSQGTFNHLPKRAIKALNKMKIKVEIVNLKRGRKSSATLERINMGAPFSSPTPRSGDRRRAAKASTSASPSPSPLPRHGGEGGVRG